MEKEKVNPHTSRPSEATNLKGTLIAVMLVGIFILVSWFGLYGLFLSR